jgi:glutamate-1-semialdehyde 2,1-aminomutase
MSSPFPSTTPKPAVSLIREHGPELACVLVDPMPNRAGLAPADRAYLEALRKVTREVGALLIFDEVITFRLGYRGAQGIWNIDPDLTTLGKIIGGGFPVGAIGGHRDVMAGVRSAPGQAGAAAWRHLLRQSRDDAGRDRCHGIAR